MSPWQTHAHMLVYLCVLDTHTQAIKRKKKPLSSYGDQDFSAEDDTE